MADTSNDCVMMSSDWNHEKNTEVEKKRSLSLDVMNEVTDDNKRSYNHHNRFSDGQSYDGPKSITMSAFFSSENKKLPDTCRSSMKENSSDWPKLPLHEMNSLLLSSGSSSSNSSSVVYSTPRSSIYSSARKSLGQLSDVNSKLYSSSFFPTSKEDSKILDTRSVYREYLKESQRRSHAEKKLLSVLSDFDELKSQLEAARNESSCLQYDNTVLYLQVDELTSLITALSFDAERFKSELQKASIAVPVSMYSEVLAVTKIPRSTPLSGSIPANLIENARLSDKEKADFSSIQGLVTTVNELQVRLRELHLFSNSMNHERIDELKKKLTSLEAENSQLTLLRDTMTERFESQLTLLEKKNDLIQKNNIALEAELSEKNAKIASFESQQEHLNESKYLEELQAKIESLQHFLMAQTNEISDLRTKATNLISELTVANKEKDYYSGSLEREREQNDALRKERDNIYNELNESKSTISSLSTDILRLNNKLDTATQFSLSKDMDLQIARNRVTELQQHLTDEHVLWDRSLQNALHRLSQTELNLTDCEDKNLRLEIQLAEKETQISLLNEQIDLARYELKDRMNSLESSLETANKQIDLLQSNLSEARESLKIEKESKQVLVDQIHNMECQALVLKRKHPNLSFEVFEDESIRFEEERLAILAESNSLKTQIEEFENLLKSNEYIINNLRSTISTQEQVIAVTEEKVKQFSDDIFVLRKTLDDKNEIIHHLETTMKEKENQLDMYRLSLESKTNELNDLNTELTQKDSLYQTKDKLHEQQLLDLQQKEYLVQLEVENMRQSHRLLVQEHSRDLQKIVQLEDELSKLRSMREEDFITAKNTYAETEKMINTLKSDISMYRRQIENLETEHHVINLENDSLRSLVNEKMDNLDISDDHIKLQLGELLRAQSTLKKELDKSRMSLERIIFELNASEEKAKKLELQTELYRSKMDEMSTQLELSKTSNNDSDVGTYKQDLIHLENRYARLVEDHKNQVNLRHQIEKQYNALLSETEPLRRQEALLQGELISIKNMLEYVEKDLATYKSKYFAALKGHQADLESHKNEIETKLTQLEQENIQLKSKCDDYQQEIIKLSSMVKELKENEKTNTEKLNSLNNVNQSLKTECAQHQTRINDLQNQKPTYDNTDIQKKYQVQVSNLQKLLQQVNSERDKIKGNLTIVQTEIRNKNTLIEELKCFKNKCESDHSNLLEEIETQKKNQANELNKTKEELEMFKKKYEEKQLQANTIIDNLKNNQDLEYLPKSDVVEFSKANQNYNSKVSANLKMDKCISTESEGQPDYPTVVEELIDLATRVSIFSSLVLTKDKVYGNSENMVDSFRLNESSSMHEKLINNYSCSMKASNPENDKPIKYPYDMKMSDEDIQMSNISVSTFKSSNYVNDSMLLSTNYDENTQNSEKQSNRDNELPPCISTEDIKSDTLRFEDSNQLPKANDRDSNMSSTRSIVNQIDYCNKNTESQNMLSVSNVGNNSNLAILTSEGETNIFESSNQKLNKFCHESIENLNESFNHSVQISNESSNHSVQNSNESSNHSVQNSNESSNQSVQNSDESSNESIKNQNEFSQIPIENNFVVPSLFTEHQNDAVTAICSPNESSSESIQSMNNSCNMFVQNQDQTIKPSNHSLNESLNQSIQNINESVDLFAQNPSQECKQSIQKPNESSHQFIHNPNDLSHQSFKNSNEFFNHSIQNSNESSNQNVQHSNESSSQYIQNSNECSDKTIQNSNETSNYSKQSPPDHLNNEFTHSLENQEEYLSIVNDNNCNKSNSIVAPDQPNLIQLSEISLKNDDFHVITSDNNVTSPLEHNNKPNL